MANIRTGFGISDITPDKPCELAGYGPGLGRVWNKVLDPLHVRVLTISSGGDVLVIASFDVVGFTPAWATALKRKTAVLAGAPEENILLSAIHTHSAPAALPLRHWGETAGETLPRMEKAYFKALEVALCNMRSVERITVREADVAGLFFNRDSFASELPDDERTDPWCRALTFHSPAGARAITSVGFHPVILGINRGVSADYPGAFMSELKAAGTNALFLPGTHGDADPIVQKTRGWGKGTVEDVACAGRELAGALCAAREREIPLEELRLAGRAWPVDLPLEALDAEGISAVAEKLEADLSGASEERKDAARAFAREWEADALAALRNGAPPAQTVPLQMLSIGPVRFACIPMEVYAGVGRMIRKALSDDSAWVISMANGAVNYLPTRAAVERGAYSSYLAPKIYGVLGYRPEAAEAVAGSFAAHADI